MIPLALTRERRATSQKEPAKPAAPSPNPKRPGSTRPDPFDFTGEGERPTQKLARQKTGSGAGQPSSSATGAAEGELEQEQEEEPEYEIECLLEQRKQGRTTRYLVNWKGYDQAEEMTWEPAASLKDTAALRDYLAPRLDIMGNRWSLRDASVSVQPAGSEEAVTLATPAPPTALACDFGGYVWLLAGSRLYRLDPRGPGYTDDGMARRECPGDAPTGCVGAYHGDGNSHEKWVEVGLPEAPLALQPPRASDHVIVTMAKAGPREVRRGVQCIVLALERARGGALCSAECRAARGGAKRDGACGCISPARPAGRPPATYPTRPAAPYHQPSPPSPPRDRWRSARMARCGWRGQRLWTRRAGARCLACCRAPTTTSRRRWSASMSTWWAARCGGAASPRASTCSMRCGRCRVLVPCMARRMARGMARRMARCIAWCTTWAPHADRLTPSRCGGWTCATGSGVTRGRWSRDQP